MRKQREEEEFKRTLEQRTNELKRRQSGKGKRDPVTTINDDEIYENQKILFEDDDDDDDKQENKELIEEKSGRNTEVLDRD